MFLYFAFYNHCPAVISFIIALFLSISSTEAIYERLFLAKMSTATQASVYIDIFFVVMKEILFLKYFHKFRYVDDDDDDDYDDVDDDAILQWPIEYQTNALFV